MKFLRELFRNDLGIFLAILNFTGLALENTKHDWRIGEILWSLTDKINFPASIIAGILTSSIFVPPGNFVWTTRFVGSPTFLLFVLLQWLFIGWLTRKIALAIRPN